MRHSLNQRIAGLVQTRLWWLAIVPGLLVLGAVPMSPLDLASTGWAAEEAGDESPGESGDHPPGEDDTDVHGDADSGHAVGTDHSTEGSHAGEHHETGSGNASESMENPAEFRTDLAIYTFVVFMLLLLILGKFAWPPIVQALEEREKNIADNIAAAEAKHEEAKKLLADHEAKLAATADEVRELLEEARRDAESTKTQIIAEAREAAEAEHARAMRDVEQAKDVALKEIAGTSARLAVELAGKVMQEELSPTHQERMVREAISRLGSASNNN